MRVLRYWICAVAVSACGTGRSSASVDSGTAGASGSAQAPSKQAPSKWTLSAPAGRVIVAGRFGPAGEPLRRVQRVIPLEGGRLAVLHSGDIIDRFDASGRWIDRVRGDAPSGRYSAGLDMRRLSGDTLLVLDDDRQRLEWVTPSGKIARTADLGGGAGPARVGLVGALPDGRLVLQSATKFAAGIARRGFFVDSSTYVVADPHARAPQTLATLPRNEAYVHSSATGVLVAAPPLGRYARATLVGRCLLYGYNDAFLVTAYQLRAAGDSGVVVARAAVKPAQRVELAAVAAVREVNAKTPVSEQEHAQLDSQVRADFAGHGDTAAATDIRRRLDEIRSHVAFSRMIAGSNGALWIQVGDDSKAGRSTWYAYTDGWKRRVEVDVPDSLVLVGATENTLFAVREVGDAAQLIAFGLPRTLSGPRASPSECN